MLRLAAMIYIFLAPTLMGIAVTVLLVMDLHTSNGSAIMWAAIGAAAVALPAAWFVASQIKAQIR